MKRLLVFLLLFPAVGFSQSSATALTPVAGTRQLAKLDLWQLSKGVYAEPDNAKGQAAFNTCMAQTPVPPTSQCDGMRFNAIIADAQDRFLLLMKALYTANTGQAERVALFTQYKIWIEQ